MNNSINSKPIVSIDLRKSNLIKIPNITLTEHNADILSKKNQNYTARTIEENTNNVSLPSTIIHLKFINDESSNTIQNKSSYSQSLNTQTLNSDSSLSSIIPVSIQKNSNYNYIKSTNLISDMRREIKANMTIGLTNKKDTNLERFEIQRYLERIKNDKQPLFEDSQTKYKKRKYSKYNKDYCFDSLKDPGDLFVKKVKYSKLDTSIESYMSEKSEINDSKLFDSKKEKMESRIKLIDEKKFVSNNKIIANSISPSTNCPLKIDPSKRLISCPASYKRKKYKLIGPKSILKQHFEKFGISNLNESRFNNDRLIFGFRIPMYQSFYQGVRMSLNDGSIKNGEETLFLLIPLDCKNHFDKISDEQLIIWKLNDNEINEMIDQVRKESVHKKNQRIMPEVLGMSYEQIELNYKSVTDVMKNYDIEPNDEDDDDESLIENDITVCENYSEENKDVYNATSNFIQPFNKLNDIREKVKLCLKNSECFYEEGIFEMDNKEDKIKTEYSKQRPKRSSVNYTSTAYAAIRAQEGGRLSIQPQKPRIENVKKTAKRYSGNSKSKIEEAQTCDKCNLSEEMCKLLSNHMNNLNSISNTKILNNIESKVCLGIKSIENDMFNIKKNNLCNNSQYINKNDNTVFSFNKDYIENISLVNQGEVDLNELAKAKINNIFLEPFINQIGVHKNEEIHTIKQTLIPFVTPSNSPYYSPINYEIINGTLQQENILISNHSIDTLTRNIDCFKTDQKESLTLEMRQLYEDVIKEKQSDILCESDDFSHNSPPPFLELNSPNVWKSDTCNDQNNYEGPPDLSLET